MRLVVGPPWLRVTVEAGAELGRRLAHSLEPGGVERARDASGPTLTVRSAAEPPASPRAGFELEGEILRASADTGEGWYDSVAGRGVVTLTPGGGAFFETFLRQIFIWESYRRGGLVLHSVAFAESDDAVVSCGESESGKSTLAAMLRTRFAVYSDEMNVVDANGRVWALPFRGTGIERVKTGGGLLRALTFHRSGREFANALLGPADAARELWPNVFVPEGADAGLRRVAFERVADVVGRSSAFAVKVPLEEGAAVEGFRQILHKAISIKDGRHEA